MEPNGASEWGNFEVDIVPNFELSVSLPVICVTLLLALRDSQILSHLGDSFSILDLWGGAKNYLSPTSDHIRGVLHFLPYKASNGDILRLA
jgi:hypothetical protein